MKKIKVLFLSVFLTSVVCAQESVTLSLTNPVQIWPVVEAALQESSVGISSFNASAGLLQTSSFEYVVLMVKNRAKYKITLSGSVITIELTDREYSSQSGWVSNPLPASKSIKEKYISSLLKKIEAISQQPSLTELAIKNSKLFPVFKGSDSQNGLTMTITSTRVIGNKIMISGQFVTSNNMEIRSMNEVNLISKAGTQFKTDDGSFAGKETGYLSQISQSMEADIPVSYDALFDVNGEKIPTIKKFSVKMYRPDNTSFAFYDIPVPMETDPNLNESTIEIYKNVYLTFKKQEDTGGHLKIYFLIENKSGKNRKIEIQDVSLIDSNGSKADDCKVFIAGEETAYKNVEAEPEVPLAGIFDFTGNIPFNTVKVLKFKTRWTADFSVKKIVFQP